MLMPILPVKLPSSVHGQQNGQVDRSLLAPVDSGDGYTRMMVAPVAEAMRALHAHALTAGIRLTTTGRGRTLDQQWVLFDTRYEPCTYLQYLAAKLGNRHKRWTHTERAKVAYRLGIDIPDSEWWHKKRYPNGTYPATAATPGSSNHGWWVADDLAEYRFGKRVSLSEPTRQWLYTNAPAYGFAWQTKAEPWHVHWTHGDDIPPALIGDDDMKLVRADGDLAVWTLGGSTLRHVVDGDVLAALNPLGPIQVLGRLGFAQFDARGTLPPGWSATDFATWGA